MALARRRSQRCLHGAYNYIRSFSFFGPNFFCNISISGSGTGTAEVSTATTLYPERNETIFIFQSKKVFLRYLNF